jgi:hypothetical protein
MISSTFTAVEIAVLLGVTAVAAIRPSLLGEWNCLDAQLGVRIAAPMTKQERPLTKHIRSVDIRLLLEKSNTSKVRQKSAETHLQDLELCCSPGIFEFYPMDLQSP